MGGWRNGWQATMRSSPSSSVRSHVKANLPAVKLRSVCGPLYVWKIGWSITQQVQLKMAHLGHACMFWLAAWLGWTTTSKPTISCDHIPIAWLCISNHAKCSYVIYYCFRTASYWCTIKICRRLSLERGIMLVVHINLIVILSPISARMLITNIPYNEGNFVSDATLWKLGATVFSFCCVDNGAQLCTFNSISCLFRTLGQLLCIL